MKLNPKNINTIIIWDRLMMDKSSINIATMENQNHKLRPYAI